MWRHKYLRVLNTITVLCIVVGLMVNVMKFTAFGIFSFMKSSSGPVKEAEGDGQIGRFNSVEAKLSFGTVKVEYGDDYGYYYKNFTTEKSKQSSNIYSCRSCSATFSNQADLRAHENAYHDY